MKKEEWRFVKGYNKKYQVSSYGRVRSFYKKKEIILKPGWGTGNYLFVVLTKDSVRKNVRIHRLVAKTFLGNIKNKIPHHKDQNRQNNYVHNLEIKNDSEHKSFHQKGEGNSNAKISSSIAKCIRELFQDNMLTIKELSLLYDITTMTVRNVINRKSWTSA